MAGVCGHRVNPQMELIPRRQLFGFAAPEEEAADAQYTFSWRIGLALHFICRSVLSCSDGRQRRYTEYYHSAVDRHRKPLLIRNFPFQVCISRSTVHTDRCCELQVRGQVSGDDRSLELVEPRTERGVPEIIVVEILIRHA